MSEVTTSRIPQSSATVLVLAFTMFERAPGLTSSRSVKEEDSSPDTDNGRSIAIGCLPSRASAEQVDTPADACVSDPRSAQLALAQSNESVCSVDVQIAQHVMLREHETRSLQNIVAKFQEDVQRLMTEVDGKMATLERAQSFWRRSGPGCLL